MPAQWSAPADAGLVVTHQHYHWEYIAALRTLMEQGRVPVLILSDGVLEFRNTWQNPTIAGGAIFQPLFGHKLACLGRAPARQIEALGNAGKCEIVGHPRFDGMATEPTIPTQASGPFRLLVTTARTPAFTEAQKQQVIEGLVQVRNRIRRNPYANGRRIEVQWRLPDQYVQHLDWHPTDHEEPRSLGDAIELADAVITTPSTVYLESVIRRRPTAILDFTNSPSYMSPAWTISAPAHVSPVLEELATPPPAKMLFQRNNLYDQLELGGAKERLFALIRVMIQSGQASRENNAALALPTRILSDPQRGIARVENEFDLASLYPADHSLSPKTETMLRQELAMAIARLGQLPNELVEKSDHIEFMHETHAQLRDENDKLIQSLDEQNEVIQSKTEHIEYLTELFHENCEKLRNANTALSHLRFKLQQQAKTIQATLSEVFAPPSSPAEATSDQSPSSSDADSDDEHANAA